MNSDMTQRTVSIASANLVWRDGVPESADFGDVYFSRDNGLDETRYVFLQHNRIEERFRGLRSGDSFVIAETGFGTGLNFLAAWQAWRNSNPPDDAVLHFVSVERFPLTPQDLLQAHALWPELAELADQLQAHYPPLVHGTHRLLLDGGRVRLTLFFGDALDGWRDLEFTADAWFLDGFAPSLNPELWVDELVTAVSRHSRPGTTVATFTAVGRVRRALIAAGFDMAKVPGFGRKREMLAGHYPQPEPCSGNGPAGPAYEGEQRTVPVVIVGAGIAGSLLARNLAERGRKVRVIDAGATPASGASGNRQGALYVKLGVEYNDQTRLALSALLYGQRYYRRFTGKAWFPTGVLQLAHSDLERQRQQKFIDRNSYPSVILRPIDQAEASRVSGLAVPSGGLWFARSGWLKPAELCQELLDHPSISVHFGINLSAIVQSGNSWQLQADNHEAIEAEQVVLCTGHRTPELLPANASYRFKPIRGQVTLLSANTIMPPNCVICGNRYLNPADGGQCLTGATFDLNDTNPDLDPASEQENLDELDSMLPGLLRTTPKSLPGRVGFRCTTHDYQPVVGTLVDNTGKQVRSFQLFTGLGSKGLSYAPILAEHLADCLTGQPQALPKPLQRRIRPERCRVQN